MFIAVDLKVIEGLAGAVARAAGVSEDRILAGLVRLWHRCWSDEVEDLSFLEMGGVFGSADLIPILAALVAFGFLESNPGGIYRVRGAERYLRLRESKRRGGKAAVSNLKRGKSPGSSAGVLPGTLPGTHPGSTPALSPNTEHRTPNTLKEEAEAREKPRDQPHQNDWDGPEDFWSWFQSRRRAGGCIGEKPPHPRALAKFWSEALTELGGDPEPLREAVFRFGDDPFWQKKTPPCPFAGFASVWPKYVPRGAVAHDA